MKNVNIVNKYKILIKFINSNNKKLYNNTLELYYEKKILLTKNYILYFFY